MKEYFSRPGVFYLALLSFGISLGFNFQLTYLSSVFKFFGAESSQLSFLWLAPAITGMIVQPVIGYMSDATTRFRNKRRPYMVGSGILAALAYWSLPYAHSLFSATLLVWVLNASVNGCLAMWRALTNDLSTDENRSTNFAFQAFCAGVGTVTGISLPYLINMINKFILSVGQVPYLTLKEVKIPFNLHVSFIISGVALTLVILVSMLKLKEPSHENIADGGQKNSSLKLVFTDLVSNLKQSSSTFKKLSLVNSLTALGIFIFWIYFILALAQNFYSLPVGLAAENGTLQSMAILQKATSDSSGYLGFSQFINVIYSLFLFFLFQRTDKAKFIHGISLLIGGTGLFVIGLGHTHSALIIAMINIGILMGSFNVLPYLIVSKIFPVGKTGVYFGLFNVSITFSQIIGGITLSPIYDYIFRGHGSYMMHLAGMLVIISGVLWLREARTRG